MKNLFKPAALAILMSVTAASTQAFAETPRRANTIENSSGAEIQQLTNRLEEIKSMDLSSMTRKQKREMKHEVKAINHKLQTQSGGVYISVGAAIIIVLLLIILL